MVFLIALIVRFHLVQAATDCTYNSGGQGCYFEGQEFQEFKARIMELANQLRTEIGLKAISWSDKIAEDIKNHLLCGGPIGFYAFGPLDSDGYLLAFYQGPKSPAERADALIHSIRSWYSASKTQYPGENLPWDHCPPTDNSTFGMLYSNKVERIGCHACHVKPNPDGTFPDGTGETQLMCITEPNYTKFMGQPYWNDYNYKKYCELHPNDGMSGCQDAPNVPGCENVDQSSDSSKDSSAKSSQSSDKSPGSKSDDKSSGSKTDDKPSGSGSSISSQFMDIPPQKYEYTRLSKANVILPGRYFIMLTMTLFI